MYELGTITVENVTHELDPEKMIVWILQADDFALVAMELIESIDDEDRWITLDGDEITISAANGRVVYRIASHDPPYPRTVVVERLTPWPIA